MISNPRNMRQYRNALFKKQRNVYFDLVISDKKASMFLPCTNDTVLNFHVLLLNRTPQRIYLLSPNPSNLCAALIAGVCIIPIPNSYDSQDIQLQLAERYLFSNRWNKNPRQQNLQDFEYLSKVQFGSNHEMLNSSLKSVRARSQSEISFQMDSPNFQNRQLSGLSDFFNQCIDHEEEKEEEKV